MAVGKGGRRDHRLLIYEAVWIKITSRVTDRRCCRFLNADAKSIFAQKNHETIAKEPSKIS